MQAEGFEIGEALSTRPTVDAVSSLYWDAWATLSDGRSNNGFGPNRITFTDICTYADMVEWPRTERPQLVKVIQQLDSIFLKHMLEKKPHG